MINILSLLSALLISFPILSFTSTIVSDQEVCRAHVVQETETTVRVEGELTAEDINIIRNVIGSDDIEFSARIVSAEFEKKEPAESQPNDRYDVYTKVIHVMREGELAAEIHCVIEGRPSSDWNNYINTVTLKLETIADGYTYQWNDSGDYISSNSAFRTSVILYHEKEQKKVILTLKGFIDEDNLVVTPITGEYGSAITPISAIIPDSNTTYVQQNSGRIYVLLP